MLATQQDAGLLLTQWEAVVAWWGWEWGVGGFGPDLDLMAGKKGPDSAPGAARASAHPSPTGSTSPGVSPARRLPYDG